ncbi:hypothetical protein K443DRAFT_670990 [Laccaria amethystina LaAM-08-1]|uniref:Peptidase M48 domain-containing protein n=1 Tax=Laccaria amethystina LaAM-08-1 TaxID=1095629 RepID=A0A0C9Y8K1_9AGAR|nr:hypothetical protein K443DRAFT_670990 [Laccaria amethystina LaAM-08-1]
MLKASTAFGFTQTASRIALTFLPILWIGNRKSHRMIKYAAIHGIPTSPEKKEKHLKRIRISNRLLQILLFIPFTLFWATIVASLERTPLTGRWRMILLSPEEEDEMAAQLAGTCWYAAVGEILAQDGPPVIIPPSDWRFAWVNDTLRKLEATIPVLSHEPEISLDVGPDEKPLPPPAKFPLRPRPRASEYLRWFCDKMCQKNKDPIPNSVHTIAGPPYSLLLIEKPEASNAFSYGFGPDGGGGIVVYSGFLDEIFEKMPLEYTTPPPKPWWANLFLGRSAEPRQPSPTPEQTTELAILLAHELSHLVLSHHLETLSSATVIVPGTLSIAADVIRVFLFPITMMFGPFVNDAVAQLGKVGSGELIKVGEYCTSVKQEIEADVVSARLLAHAGFDARDAVKFWTSRSSQEIQECASANRVDTSVSRSMTLGRRIMGAGHPVNEGRVESLKGELARWEAERVEARVKAGLTPEAAAA